MSALTDRAVIGGQFLGWSVRAALRESGSLVVLAVFLMLFYGIVMSSAAMSRGSATETLSVLHWIAWGTNILVLLMWGPSRIAQRLATEKEKGTLELLRMTGLSGRQLALGLMAGALALPTLFLLGTLPVVLLGAFGREGLAAPLRAYPVLLALGACAALAAGLIGLAAKKAQGAGSGAVFLGLVLLAGGGFYKVPGLEPLGVLGPWGSGLTTVHHEVEYELHLLGARVPGELVQLPALVVLAWALLHGLSRRLAGEPAVLLGRPAATAVSMVLVALVAATFPTRVHHRIDGAEALAGHLVLLLVALLPLAVEVPVSWSDLLRGQARRDADDPPRADEQLRPSRLVLGPALALLGAALLALLAGQRPDVPDARQAALVGGAVVAAAWLVATLALQAAVLLGKDQGAPRVLAGIAVAALWLGPLAAGWGLREAGAPDEVVALPRVLSAPYCAAIPAAKPRALALDPTALATACAALHAFAAMGLLAAVRGARDQARDLAGSLVALPADVDRAAGELGKRCPNGHVFASTWAECPHCPDARRAG